MIKKGFIALLFLLLLNLVYAVYISSAYTKADIGYSGTFSLSAGNQAITRTKSGINYSYFLININGTVLRIDNETGDLSVNKSGDTLILNWNYKNIIIVTITATMETNFFSDREDITHFKVWIRNNGRNSYNIGLKVILDSQATEDDRNPEFYVPGVGQLSSSKVFEGNVVPDYIVTMSPQPLDYPSFFLSFYGEAKSERGSDKFNNRKNCLPDALGIGDKDFASKTSFSFGSEGQSFSSGSFVSFHWDPHEFKSGQENGVGFDIGQHTFPSKTSSVNGLKAYLIYPRWAHRNFWTSILSFNNNKASKITDLKGYLTKGNVGYYGSSPISGGTLSFKSKKLFAWRCKKEGSGSKKIGNLVAMGYKDGDKSKQAAGFMKNVTVEFY